MLDWLLAFYLLIALPCMQMWRSFHPSTDTTPGRIAGYRKSAAKMVVLLAVLALSCWQEGRGVQALGLDIPVSKAGWWGLAGTALLLLALQIGTRWTTARQDGKRRQEMVEHIKANKTMPRTSRELGAFVPTVILVGAGWELLYRGFLLMLLTPLTGSVAAIILAALAYGFGHGYERKSQLGGSIVSAFLFTLAFYYTQSLWWLIVLHIGLPLFGAISSVNACRADSGAGGRA